MNQQLNSIKLLLALFLLIGISCQETKFIPKSSGQIIHHRDYILAYSEKDEQAYWVSYKLTKSEVQSGTKRKDNFREDPNVSTGSATLEDYRKSGYDRGHLKPAADSKENALEMSESFYLSNISPQNQKFNRGIWNDLEELVRFWAIKEQAVHVIVGPVLRAPKNREMEPTKKIGKNSVSVPKYFYKIVLDLTGEKKAIAFLIPNRDISENLGNFIVKIDSLESLTGIDFFHELPDSLENCLESSNSFEKWPKTNTFKIDKPFISNPSLQIKNDSFQFSINKKSGVRHNSGCKAYQCKNCEFTNDSTIGRPCGICGG